MVVAEWAQGVHEVHERAKAYPGPDRRPSPVVQGAQRVKQQRQYEQELSTLCRAHLNSEAPMRVLCQRIQRFLPELFALVADSRVPADNPDESGRWSGVYVRRW